MKYTTSALAKMFNTTATTIRTWSAEFADYLSPAANPPKGNVRSFPAEDLRVFALVASRREVGQQYEDIRLALANGERAEPPQGEGQQQERPHEENNALVMRLTASLAKFEGELSATKQERDRLLGELDELRQAHQAMTERAISAETTASMLQQQLKPTDANLSASAANEGTPAPEAPAGASWWSRFGDWLFGGG